MGMPAGGEAFVLLRLIKCLILLGSEKHDGNLVEVFPVSALGARHIAAGLGSHGR